MQYAVHRAHKDLDVDMEGDFTFNDSDGFRRLMEIMNDEYCTVLPSNIHLNFNHVERIDASALDMLLDAIMMAKKHHQQLTIEQPHGQVEQRLLVAAQYNNSLVIVK